MAPKIPPAIVRRNVEPPSPFEVVRTEMPDGSVVERQYCSNAWAVYMMGQRRNRRLTPGR